MKRLDHTLGIPAPSSETAVSRPVLMRAIVVRPVGDGRPHFIAAHLGPHQHVGGGLGRRTGARRAVKRGLVKPPRIIKRKIPVHLFGGDVMQPHPCRRTASGMVNVPIMLARKNGAGSANELST